MGRVLSISGTDQLPLLSGEHSRLRFGVEFCSLLMPGARDVLRAAETAAERGAKFELVTPFVAEPDFKRIAALLEHVAEQLDHFDLIVNDWGVYDVAASLGIGELTLGRVLNRKRAAAEFVDPEASGLSALPPGFYPTVSRTAADNTHYQDFLVNKGFVAAEYDNTLAGFDLGPSKLKRYLHVPYVFVTTTRRCGPGFFYSNSQQAHCGVHPGGCTEQCLGHVFKLDISSYDVEILLRGNTQFYVNDHVPVQAEELFEQLIYHPDLPY